MTWTAIILFLATGFLGGEVKPVAQIPMRNRDACERFATDFTKQSSKYIGVICVSSDTGEAFAMQGNKR